MSPQNIAIVMAPNLLWATDTSEDDYMAKVNSTASVNTVVEALVSDWSYFFGDEFVINDFYVTLSRDDLFPDNGGFPFDRDPQPENIIAKPQTDNSMTKSLNMGTSASLDLPASNNINNNHGMSSSFNYQTHSRSSSHDASLILLSGNNLGYEDNLAKRSQSNSSLSDGSPPNQGSPKLPIRRKHNKQLAPTPPDSRINRAAEHYSALHQEKEKFFNAHNETQDPKEQASRFIRTEASAQNSNIVNAFKPPHPVSMKHCHGSTENLAAKPDKPPRPALPVLDTQTLTRNAYKTKGGEKPGRPVALPRNILNVTRSTENLTLSSSPSPHKPAASPISHTSAESDDQDETVLRDKHQLISVDHARADSTLKPAIPERPTSLMKPTFRTAVFDKFETQQIHPQKQQNEQNTGIKKAQSFRLSSNGQLDDNSASRSQAALERTHIYNVDKQQVEFIDVNEAENNNTSTEKNGVSSGNEVHAVRSDENHVGKKDEPIHQFEAPHSPRNFDPKLIKRPQIPAPPPPKPVLPLSVTETNQESETKPLTQIKADGNPGDSTKL